MMPDEKRSIGRMRKHGWKITIRLYGIKSWSIQKLKKPLAQQKIKSLMTGPCAFTDHFFLTDPLQQKMTTPYFCKPDHQAALA
jgi:hypothetical protein